MINEKFDITQINHLLTRYYEGKTSIDEEKLLIKYFSTEQNVPEHLSIDKEMFLSLANVKNDIDIPVELEQNISSTIDRLYRQERFNQRRFIRYTISIAASLLLVIGIGIHFLVPSSINRHEITNPEIAYLETEQALTLLSQKLNKANGSYNKTNETLININQNFNAILK